MNDELRKKLLGRLPYSQKAKEVFVPEYYLDLPKEYQPEYTIRPFNKSEKDESMRIAIKLSCADQSNGEEIQKLIFEMNDLAKSCIITIKNLWDVGEEKYIDFERSILEFLPVKVLQQVYSKCSVISCLKTEDKLGL